MNCHHQCSHKTAQQSYSKLVCNVRMNIKNTTVIHTHYIFHKSSAVCPKLKISLTKLKTWLIAVESFNNAEVRQDRNSYIPSIIVYSSRLVWLYRIRRLVASVRETVRERQGRSFTKQKAWPLPSRKRC